jgi:benzoyl-CoA reductase/2-hydroxyglutaryl-CoA dehydratase subunit BcrC/BadD/HgdB
MCAVIEPLINDEFCRGARKRTLSAILAKKSGGAHGVGIYCAYAPFELIRAAGAVPNCRARFPTRRSPAAENRLFAGQPSAL